MTYIILAIARTAYIIGFVKSKIHVTSLLNYGLSQIRRALAVILKKLTAKMILQKDIEISIQKYFEDIVNYPLFFDPEKIPLLKTEYFKNQISNKINSNFQNSLAQVFTIPYNEIASRKVLSLEFEDIIVRYIIQNKLSELIDITNDQVSIENSQLILLLDIQNFYESINHQLLISIVSLFSKLEKDDKIIGIIIKSSVF